MANCLTFLLLSPAHQAKLMTSFASRKFLIRFLSLAETTFTMKNDALREPTTTQLESLRYTSDSHKSWKEFGSFPAASSRKIPCLHRSLRKTVAFMCASCAPRRLPRPFPIARKSSNILQVGMARVAPSPVRRGVWLTLPVQFSTDSELAPIVPSERRTSKNT